MTVQELIQMLATLDPTLPVVVAGYERGFNDITQIKPVEVVLNVNEEWYYGSHDIPQNIDSDVSQLSLTPVIFLGGENTQATEPYSQSPLS